MRVLVADDEALLRQGLVQLLAKAGFEVAGEARDAAELLRLVDVRRPDLVLTDIKMPPEHTDEGITAAREIRAKHPEIGVLVLSHYLESRYAMQLLEAFPERTGYLLKDRVSDIAVLADALQRIAEGECVVDPTIVARLVARRENAGPLAQLTEREREVLALMAEGHANRAIAKRLFLSPKDGRRPRRADLPQARHRRGAERAPTCRRGARVPARYRASLIHVCEVKMSWPAGSCCENSVNRSRFPSSRQRAVSGGP